MHARTYARTPTFIIPSVMRIDERQVRMRQRPGTLYCLLALLLCLLPHRTRGQGTVFEASIDPESGGTGQVYFLMFFFFMLTIIAPIGKYIYTFYIDRLVQKATKQFEEVAQRLSDRVSDAGRKISEEMKVV